MPRFSECWRCGNTVGVGILCRLCEVAKYCSKKCHDNDIFRHEAECIPASVLKTCKACRKSGPNHKACTGCYQAFYCDGKCQKSHWERHKIDCLETKQMIEATAQAMKRGIQQSSYLCSYYYWGNIPAIDCLNLVENESEAYGSPLKVLILGVGDLRNVALTCASLPDSYSQKILFTLNDKESCVLARLVLLLYMLTKGDLGIEKAVTEIWYSVLLSEATYKDLCTSLEELINLTSAQTLQSKTDGMIMVDETQFKQLQDVWKNWLGLQVTGTKWIRKKREEIPKLDVGSIALNSSYIQNIPVQHANAAKKWLEDGVFNRTQGPTYAENPTLTGVDLAARFAPYSYCIPSNVFPFSGWDYLQVKKFKSSNCLVTMYGDYIECILRKFMKILSKQQVSFHIALCDCMDIKQHLEADIMYDRILTSNLMDYVFLPNLLQLCSQMLSNENSHATVITETILWAAHVTPVLGIPHPWHHVQKLSKLAFEDTKRFFTTGDGGTSVREYQDDSSKFFDYLRATFYANRLKNVAESGSTNPKPTIPVIKELGNEFQLYLRDGIRNENRIVFFRPAINRRRVTLLMGTERFLEWIPKQKK